MKRREFLNSLIQAVIVSNANFRLASLAFASSTTASNSRAFLVGGRRQGAEPKTNQERRMVEDSDGQIRLLDLSKNLLTSIDVDFVPHGFAQNAGKPEMMASVSKWAHRGAVFNIATGKVLSRLTAPTGMRFFGHSQYDFDGNLLVTAAAGEGDEGKLLRIAPLSGKVIDILPTGGRAPHDFFLLDKHTACIANSGYTLFDSKATGSLTWVDLVGKKVLRTDPVPFPGHLLREAQHTVVVGSRTPASPLGELYQYDFDSKKLRSSKNSEFYDELYSEGEKLSLGDIRDGLVAVTTAKGKKILFWDLQNNRISGKFFQVAIRGLAVRENDLLVTTDDGKLFSIATGIRGSIMGPETLVHPDFSNSSHLKLVSI